MIADNLLAEWPSYPTAFMVRTNWSWGLGIYSYCPNLCCRELCRKRAVHVNQIIPRLAASCWAIDTLSMYDNLRRKLQYSSVGQAEISREIWRSDVWTFKSSTTVMLLEADCKAVAMASLRSFLFIFIDQSLGCTKHIVWEKILAMMSSWCRFHVHWWRTAGSEIWHVYFADLVWAEF